MLRQHAFRLLLAVPLASLVLVSVLGVAAADGARWVRGYPEVGREGCTWYVADWSDGIYSRLPLSCPAGVRPGGAGPQVSWVRSYPELGAEGCTWYVALWADGAYSRVPFACAPGTTLWDDGRLTGGSFAPVAPGAAVVHFYEVRVVPPGGTADVRVHTAPGARCTLTVILPNGNRLSAQGLEPLAADADGQARWAFVVPRSTPTGLGALEVHCNGAVANEVFDVGF